MEIVDKQKRLSRTFFCIVYLAESPFKDMLPKKFLDEAECLIYLLSSAVKAMAAEVRGVKVRILFFVFKVSASFNDSEKGVFLYRGTHVRYADMSPI